MAVTTNATPYWDDFDPENQFVRILFRPGFAIQARELTQLQTSLQKQIEYSGKHLFVHGARVLDGELAYSKCNFIKLADTEDNDPASDAVNPWRAYSNTTLLGVRIGLDANAAGDYTVDSDGETITPYGDRKPVAQVVLASNRTSDGDPATLLIAYESGDEFAANDFITAFGYPTAEFDTALKAVVNATVTSSGDSTGRASYASIANGVYFVAASSGSYFAYVPKQKVVLEKYSNTPTYKVGLSIDESFVTPEEDATLYDNAQGTYQTSAPGAHRLKLELTLSVAPGSDGSTIDPDTAADFVELLRVENGQRSYGADSQNPIYNVLGEALAERTFDESGNYVVDDFDCRVEEAPGDQLKVTVQPMSGKSTAKAYIRGHQYEQSGTWTQYIEKARKTAIVTDIALPLDIGSYFLIKDLNSQGAGEANWINPGRLPTWDVHTVNTYLVDVSTALNYKSTKAGTFRIRDVVYVGANTHAIYVTDFRGSPALTGNFSASPDVTGAIGVPGSNEVKIQTGNSSASDDAYLGAKVTIVYSHLHGDFVGQTRVVVKSDSDTLWLDRNFDQPSDAVATFPGVTEKYALNADLFAATTGNGCIIGTGIDDFTTDIDEAVGKTSIDAPLNKLSNGVIYNAGTLANTSLFQGGSFPELLFPLPVGSARVANSLAHSTTGIDFTAYGKYSDSTTASSGTATFASSGFRQGAYAGKATFATTDKNAFVFINETRGITLVPDMITSTAPTVTTFAITSPQIGTSDVVRMIGPVKVTGLNAQGKTLLRGINSTQVSAWALATDRTTSGNSHVVFATPNTKPNEKDNLGLCDIYQIVDVYDTGQPETAPTGLTLNNSLFRVTNNYTLDHGQSEDAYDYASVVLKPGAPAPVGQLLVVVDRFLHSGDNKSGVFTVDSYSAQVSLDNIPVITSTKTGRKYALKDHIDYRPSRMVDTASTGAANTSYYVPFGHDPNGDHTTGLELFHPDPDGSFLTAMQFFAPRFDKIVLSLRTGVSGANTGFLKIVSGTTDRSPAVPPHVDLSDMTLFTLALPSYTPTVSEVSIMKEGNRRWTMRAIDSMERRIDNLEYYSTLNMLEQDMNAVKIFDATGQFERFKHGFLVDSFDTGTALADVGSVEEPNLDFQASIGGGVLRPAVETENITLNIDSSLSTGVQVSSGVLHLPYTNDTDDTKLQQVRATADGVENLNPFHIQRFQGTVSLSPRTDFWKSVLDAPESHIDTSGRYSAMGALLKTLNDRMGPAMYQWGEWKDDWYGIPNNIATKYAHFGGSKYGSLYNLTRNYPKTYTSAKVAAATTRLQGKIGAKANYSVSLDSISTPDSAKLRNIYGIRKRFSNKKYRKDLSRQMDTYLTNMSSLAESSDVHQNRVDQESQFRLKDEQQEIGERLVNSNLAQYMRPLDIVWRVQGLKPETTMYPHFDAVDVRPYTERANELTLRHVSGSSEFFPSFRYNPSWEEILTSSSTGDGISVGFAPGANTYYLVSANGNYLADDTITGSVTGAADDGFGREVVEYKSYSGAVKGVSTTTTVFLDDSAANSGSWYTTTEGSRAKDAGGGSLGRDLYGRTIYIVEGRGYGQSRTISAFSNTTGMLTVDTAWGVTPNTQSRYSIGDHKTNRSGGLYGVLHVPNYNVANRLITDRQEGDAGSSAATGVWSADHVNADEYTTDRTRFLVGNKTFQVRDTLDPLSIDLHSFGAGIFKAAGVVETKQRTKHGIFGVYVITTNINSAQSMTNMGSDSGPMSRRIEMGRVNWMDPIAQVITVDPHAYPEGIYVNAVDLWFRSKPNTTGMTAGYGLPVIVQIRPMLNGVPSGAEALASSWRYSSEVKVSAGSRNNAPGTANAATTTNFAFDHPVYLASGESYAIVVESNSIDYDLWTAKIGSTQAGTGGSTGIPTVTVDSQSHLGAFYKSQNGTIWAGEFNQNLMFRLHKCVFDTDTVGSALFKTANSMSEYQPPHTRIHNALDHTEWPGDAAALGDVSQNPYTFKLWNKDFVFHRFRVDTSTLEYPSGTLSFEYAGTDEGVDTVPNPSTLDQLDGYVGMELNEDTVANTSLTILKDKTGSFLLRGALSTLSADVSPMIDLERISLTMIRNLINNGELYANTWPTNYVVTDSGAPAGTIAGGGFYIASPGTAYVDGDAVTITTEAGNIGVEAAGTAIVNGTGSIVGITLTNSGHTYLHTPTVSVAEDTGSGAVIYYVGEDEPKGPGNFQARYMTKKVPLMLDAEARDIKVFLTAAQPLGTTIWVYTKVRNKADIDKFDDKRWVLMKRMQSFSEELSDSETDFNDISFMGASENDDEYPLSYDANSDGVAYSGDDGPSGERYNTFNEFAIKIVLQSNDARVVPVIADVRAVAVE